MILQSEFEEKLNTISHGIGFILSVIGCICLFVFIEITNLLSTISLLLYGISLCSLYFASTIYHYTKDPNKKRLFRKLDHINIYYLIAGTYSPVVLITLIDSKGILLFSVVWGIAIIGTLLKLFFTGRFEFISVVLYLLMGWLIIFDYEALSLLIPQNGLLYLFYGGIAYTTGIIFYAIKNIPYNHFIWHLFVLAGSSFHYVFILFFII